MTRARAIAPPPVLYDDTPIHDKMESVQFPMIDVFTRVPSNGHGQSGRL
jgi:hypothetical protein